MREGLRETELREIADCGLCGEPVGSSGLPLFWRVRAVRYGLDLEAIRRQDGLGVALASPRLAQVMGPCPVLANVMSEREITVCEQCAAKVTVYEVGLTP